MIKKFLWDTAAFALFSVGATGIEHYFADINLDQSLIVRYATIPLLFTGWLYGRYRNRMYKKFKTAEEQFLAGYCVDVLTLISFKGPLYVFGLVVSGSSIDQILTACGYAALALAIVGRPFGRLLDVVSVDPKRSSLF